MPTIRVEGVEVSYGGETVLEVEDLALEGPGLVQVLGPNGAGKTTLLRTILGLVEPRRGRVLIDGVEVTARPELAGRYAGYVPQLAPESLHYPVTPRELVSYELLARRRRGSPEEALRLVGLPEDAWDRPIRSLSGGQRQRVLIARAIAHDPPILLMDEPLSAVDPAGRAELASLIARLAESKLVVVTSHDPVLLLDHTKTVVLVNRRLVAAGPPSAVLSVPVLRGVYGPAALEVGLHVHICDSHAG